MNLVALPWLLAVLVMSPAALAQNMPRRGELAPGIELRTVADEAFSSKSAAPHPLVLIFGDTDHEGTRRACRELVELLREPELVEARAALIIPSPGKSTSPDFPGTVLHDPARAAFEAFHVIALPSVVVVDGAGKVVHSLPGYLHNGRQTVRDALLCALAKMTPEEFERSLSTPASDASAEQTRADRLVHLGRELARHKLFDQARARYAEADAIMHGHLGAAIAAADSLLKEGKLEEAESRFRELVTRDPASIDASLGLAATQIARGGSDIDSAERSLRSMIAKPGALPRAHYLLGCVHEARGRTADAAAEYRRAAEMLLEP